MPTKCLKGCLPLFITIKFLPFLPFPLPSIDGSFKSLAVPKSINFIYLDLVNNMFSLLRSLCTIPYKWIDFNPNFTQNYYPLWFH